MGSLGRSEEHEVSDYGSSRIDFVLTLDDLKIIRMKYHIPKDFKLEVAGPEECIALPQPRQVAMNPSDLEALRRMAKKRKTSTAAAPKCAQTEAVRAQPVAGGYSRAANAPRKEKASVKDVMPLQSATLGETVP
ncbi:hypothetical protein COCNU_03G001810 [Cocos nucifera]|uniref:Uncharacterized protein n=1 Tax=Cocos nucifera TaxID=13894 RepID=A0A8K0MXS6_COCNU|nr:hypothetical protein COCNU_03G001810 [Cocos nucifera]